MRHPGGSDRNMHRLQQWMILRSVLGVASSDSWGSGSLNGYFAHIGSPQRRNHRLRQLPRYLQHIQYVAFRLSCCKSLPDLLGSEGMSLWGILYLYCVADVFRFLKWFVPRYSAAVADMPRCRCKHPGSGTVRVVSLHLWRSLLFWLQYQHADCDR